MFDGFRFDARYASGDRNLRGQIVRGFTAKSEARILGGAVALHEPSE